MLLLLAEDAPSGCVAEEEDSGREVETGPLERVPKRPKAGCFTGDDTWLRGLGVKPCFSGMGANGFLFFELELVSTETGLGCLLVCLDWDRVELVSNREEAVRELVDKTGSFFGGDPPSRADRSRSPLSFGRGWKFDFSGICQPERFASSISSLI